MNGRDFYYSAKSDIDINCLFYYLIHGAEALRITKLKVNKNLNVAEEDNSNFWIYLIKISRKWNL